MKNKNLLSNSSTKKSINVTIFKYIYITIQFLYKKKILRSVQLSFSDWKLIAPAFIVH